MKQTGFPALFKDKNYGDFMDLRDVMGANISKI
jgi:hypothetical protein